uniref:Uncharacterized protein n=1 Tax=Brassica campestris TaxID=3711 RepID=A0A3P6D080_BRACM|nr:unnamed protein product [Brassica rapa]
MLLLPFNTMKTVSTLLCPVGSAVKERMMMMMMFCSLLMTSALLHQLTRPRKSRGKKRTNQKERKWVKI